MTAHLNLPRLVVPADTPEHVQHMATDINDALNRINAVVTKLIADVETLEAWVVAHGP